jgi:hypothetical protein
MKAFSPTNQPSTAAFSRSSVPDNLIQKIEFFLNDNVPDAG